MTIDSAVGTPNVSLTYDPVYNRVTGMSDGSGSTSYTYNPVNGAVGAGRLASVAAPVYGTGQTATVAYTYDQLGRVVSRTVDGGSTVGTTFDALGRVTNLTNPLGAFTYGYVDTTSRLSSVIYPSGTGLSTSYAYFNNVGDQRLQDITNAQGGTTLSKFDYTYNAVGTVATWTQQTDSNTPVQYAMTYDNADQLIDAEQTNASTGTLLTSNKYNYDPSGNRLAETTLSGTTTGQFNRLNQLMGLTTSTGTQIVSGYTTGTATSVTVNAIPATVSNATNFTAQVPLGPGTNAVSIVAHQAHGSPTTQLYQIVNAGAPASQLSYDGDGNTLTDESGNHYTWDALSRLTAITYPSGASSNFAYDGLSRRVQIVEKDSSGSVTSTKNYLWIGLEIAEERDGSNSVQKRFFPRGEQQAGTNCYYTSDHEGSTRELCNSTGTIVARYGYDSYGATTLVQGTDLASRQYAGYYHHPASGLNLTCFRPYNANTSRWLSRDPIEEAGGLHLYRYVDNDPTDQIDRLGLDPSQTIVIDLKNNTLCLYDGSTKGTPVLTTDCVHGAGTTVANTTPTGTYTLGPWQKDKLNAKFGATDKYSDSILYNDNPYGPYFTPIKGTGGDGIHGTVGWSKGTWWLTHRLSPVSHGCVRVPNDVIINLHDNLLKNPDGTHVIIK